MKLHPSDYKIALKFNLKRLAPALSPPIGTEEILTFLIILFFPIWFLIYVVYIFLKIVIIDPIPYLFKGLTEKQKKRIEDFAKVNN